MGISNGRYANPSLPPGKEASSAASKADALLADTLDELTTLFRLEEAFPFAPEVDRAERKSSLLSRIKDWLFRRPARARPGTVSPGADKRGASKANMAVAGTVSRRGHEDARHDAQARPAQQGSADQPVAGVSGADERRDCGGVRCHGRSGGGCRQPDGGPEKR